MILILSGEKATVAGITGQWLHAKMKTMYKTTTTIIATTTASTFRLRQCIKASFLGSLVDLKSFLQNPCAQLCLVEQ